MNLPSTPSTSETTRPKRTADDRPAVTVSASGLDKQFGQRWILHNASFDLYAGESVALLGESGVGKSTVLNILAGLEPTDRGELTVAGRQLVSGAFDADSSAAMRRQSIGFVFQAFHLLAHLTVWQNVALPLLLNGSNPAQARAPVEVLLQRIGMADRAEARPSVLSGGEQQRVCLARALVHQPALLLADEPTGNLDPQTAALALKLMQDVVAETGCAMMMVTHSEQAAGICSRRLHLADGAIRSAT